MCQLSVPGQGSRPEGCTLFYQWKACDGALEQIDSVGMCTLMVLVSGPKVQQRCCFSWSTSCLGQYMDPLQQMNWHHLLLVFEALPRIWKFILEGYSGKEAMWNQHCGTLSIPTCLPMRASCGEAEQVIGPQVTTVTLQAYQCVPLFPLRSFSTGGTDMGRPNAR